jgi:hypothetical protein
MEGRCSWFKGANRTFSVIAFAAVVALSADSLKANVMAYLTTGTDQFGTLDLDTGQFTLIANTGVLLAGLGVIDGKLYGRAEGTDQLYQINTTNGSLTPVGTGAITYSDFGSTTAGLFGTGRDGHLYSIDPSNGSAIEIGNTGLGCVVCGMSVNTSALYYTNVSDFYSLDTTTGAPTLIGNTGQDFGALLYEAGTLWAGGYGGIFNLNPTDGKATFVASLSGTTSTFWGLAPDPLPASAVPEPGYIGLLGGSLGLVALARRRLAR